MQLFRDNNLQLLHRCSYSRKPLIQNAIYAIRVPFLFI